MRKWVFLLLTLSLIGCGRAHVYHTYYKDIDIDTMDVAFERDSHNWYLVRHVEKDSFYWVGRWFDLKGPIKDYYCPDLDIYEETFPDNQGRIIVVEIDPYTQFDWLKE